MATLTETIDLCREFKLNAERNSRLLIFPFLKYRKSLATNKVNTVGLQRELLERRKDILSNIDIPDLTNTGASSIDELTDQLNKKTLKMLDSTAKILEESIPARLIWYSMPKELRNNEEIAQVAESNEAPTLARLIRTTKKPKFF